MKNYHGDHKMSKTVKGNKESEDQEMEEREDNENIVSTVTRSCWIRHWLVLATTGQTSLFKLIF